MDTKNDEITMDIVLKEAWKQPELTELDINKTESGDLPVLELGGLTGNLIS